MTTSVNGLLGQVGSGISGPPTKMRQNETIYIEDVPFNDRFNNTRDANSYSLQYAFAGPASTPVIVTATPTSTAGVSGLNGSGWLTSFTAAQAAQMIPGLWFWQAVLIGYSANFNATIAGQVMTLTGSPTGAICVGATLTGTGIPANTQIVSGSGLVWNISTSLTIGSAEAMSTAVIPQRIVAAEGQMTVEPDLSTLTGVYDGRSTMQIGLANCENALLVFQSSGGRIKDYTIAGRKMTFQDDKEIRALADWFRARVNAEKFEASGGDQRMIRIGFAPPSSGIPTSSSKNWPWW